MTSRNEGLTANFVWLTGRSYRTVVGHPCSCLFLEIVTL